MNVPYGRIPGPHFRLHSEALAGVPTRGEPAGRWRFVLRSTDGRTCLEAEDDEPETSTERLELLAIVRALESLDEPARVTLVAPGRSISRGIRYGVAQWRENEWQWERYGKLTPVKNGDLWRRIDRAMSIHDVVCRDAPAGADDLAAIPTRSVNEGSADPADVRVIHRTHRGRRFRIDPATPAASSSPLAPRPRSVRSASPMRHCFDAVKQFFRRLLPAHLTPSRPTLREHCP